MSYTMPTDEPEAGLSEEKMLRALLEAMEQEKIDPPAHTAWFVRCRNLLLNEAEELDVALSEIAYTGISPDGPRRSVSTKCSIEHAALIIETIERCLGSDANIVLEKQGLTEREADSFFAGLKSIRTKREFGDFSGHRAHNKDGSVGMTVGSDTILAVSKLLETSFQRHRYRHPHNPPKPDVVNPGPQTKPRRQVNPRSSFVSYGDVNPVKENQPKAEDGVPAGTPAL